MEMRSDRIMVFQLGARRHYAVARGLHAVNSLERLMTDACGASFPFAWFRPLRRLGVRMKGLEAVLERQPKGLELGQIMSMPAFFVDNYVRELWDRKSKRGAQIWIERNRRFANSVSRYPWGKTNVVYGYNAAALEVFREAKRRGMRCILDQTAAPWRFNTRMLLDEQAKWPGWEDMPADMDVSHEMAKREEAEWELADRIICGSQFVVDRIQEVGGPHEKCRVVLYPDRHADPVTANREGTQSEPTRPSTSSIRLLYPGTLQLRKGIQYFYEFSRELRSAKFVWRAVGPSLLSEEAMNRLREEIQVVGRVARYEMAQHYTWADAIVLPTLSEGCANVCLEALALGKEVITTEAAGIAPGMYPGLHVVRIEAMSRFLQGYQRSQRLVGSLPSRSIADYGCDLISAIDPK